MTEKLEIIEVKPYGVVVKNINFKIRQIIPLEKFKKRFKWGLYEIVNLSSFPLIVEQLI